MCWGRIDLGCVLLFFSIRFLFCRSSLFRKILSVWDGRRLDGWRYYGVLFRGKGSTPTFGMGSRAFLVGLRKANTLLLWSGLVLICLYPGTNGYLHYRHSMH